MFIENKQHALNTHPTVQDETHTFFITPAGCMHLTLQIHFERFMTVYARINQKIFDDLARIRIVKTIVKFIIVKREIHPVLKDKQI